MRRGGAAARAAPQRGGQIGGPKWQEMAEGTAEEGHGCLVEEEGDAGLVELVGVGLERQVCREVGEEEGARKLKYVLEQHA